MNYMFKFIRMKYKKKNFVTIKNIYLPPPPPPGRQRFPRRKNLVHQPWIRELGVREYDVAPVTMAYAQ